MSNELETLRYYIQNCTLSKDIEPERLANLITALQTLTKSNMTISTNYFSRVICAFMLSVGMVVSGCYDDSALQEHTIKQGTVFRQSIIIGNTYRLKKSFRILIAKRRKNEN